MGYSNSNLRIRMTVCPLSVLTDQAKITTLLSMFGKAFNTVAFDVIYMYTSELYPTNARIRGLGMASTTARIGSVLASYVALMVSSWAN